MHKASQISWPQNMPKLSVGIIEEIQNRGIVPYSFFNHSIHVMEATSRKNESHGTSYDVLKRSLEVGYYLRSSCSFPMI